ncbi:MAG: ABC transporter ATP-binding protein, partial [Chroococcidiopsidaceae cyanobacterium CP_BM_RX_35]|nr:ABC transporter ATP-binding protein [Chroococcidiopsidaceae cyanobacterium CP_BM_RX_35]
MYLKLPLPILRVLKATSLWKHNYLILREFKHFRKIVVLAIIFMFLAAIFEGFGLGFLLAFLQGLTTPNAKPVETGIGWFDIWILGVNNSSINRFYRISTIIVIVTWMRATFNYFAQLYSAYAEISLVDGLRKRIFDQLQAQSLSFFAKKRSGELIDILTNEVERIRQIFSGMSFLVTRGITLIVYSLSMFLISWQLSIISILLFGLLAIGLSTLNRRIREFSFGISIATGQFTSTALEFINGIRTVHAFSTLDFERKRYYQASFEVVKAWKKVYSTSVLVKPLAESISTVVLIGMIAAALTSKLLPIASLLTFFFVLFRLVPTV